MLNMYCGKLVDVSLAQELPSEEREEAETLLAILTPIRKRAFLSETSLETTNLGIQAVRWTWFH